MFEEPCCTMADLQVNLIIISIFIFLLGLGIILLVFYYQNKKHKDMLQVRKSKSFEILNYFFSNLCIIGSWLRFKNCYCYLVSLGQFGFIFTKFKIEFPLELLPWIMCWEKYSEIVKLITDVNMLTNVIPNKFAHFWPRMWKSLINNGFICFSL